jgi:hypothetical protein
MHFPVAPLRGKDNPALVWLVETIDTVQRTGFASAIGADNGQNFTFVNLKAQASEGVGATEAEMNIFHAELNWFEGHHHLVFNRKFFISP